MQWQHSTILYYNHLTTNQIKTSVHTMMHATSNATCVRVHHFLQPLHKWHRLLHHPVIASCGHSCIAPCGSTDCVRLSRTTDGCENPTDWTFAVTLLVLLPLVQGPNMYVYSIDWGHWTLRYFTDTSVLSPNRMLAIRDRHRMLMDYVCGYQTSQPQRCMPEKVDNTKWGWMNPMLCGHLTNAGGVFLSTTLQVKFLRWSAGSKTYLPEPTCRLWILSKLLHYIYISK